jgi:hypothetical protein
VTYGMPMVNAIFLAVEVLGIKTSVVMQNVCALVTKNMPIILILIIFFVEFKKKIALK